MQVIVAVVIIGSVAALLALLARAVERRQEGGGTASTSPQPADSPRESRIALDTVGDFLKLVGMRVSFMTKDGEEWEGDVKDLSETAQHLVMRNATQVPKGRRRESFEEVSIPLTEIDGLVEVVDRYSISSSAGQGQASGPTDELDTALVNFAHGRWEHVLRADLREDAAIESAAELLLASISALANARSGRWDQLVVLQLLASRPQHGGIVGEADKLLSHRLTAPWLPSGNKYLRGLRTILALWTGSGKDTQLRVATALAFEPRDPEFDGVLTTIQSATALGQHVACAAGQDSCLPDAATIEAAGPQANERPGAGEVSQMSAAPLEEVFEGFFGSRPSETVSGRGPSGEPPDDLPIGRVVRRDSALRSPGRQHHGERSSDTDGSTGPEGFTSADGAGNEEAGAKRCVVDLADPAGDVGGSIPDWADVVSVEVSRRMIEEDDYATMDELVACVTATPCRLAHFRGRVHLRLGGYDEDPRDGPEIPEVRRWFSELHSRHPHLVYFINPSLPGVTAAIYLGMVGMGYDPKGEVRRVDTAEGSETFMVGSAAALVALLVTTAESIASLCSQNAVPWRPAVHGLLEGYRGELGSGAIDELEKSVFDRYPDGAETIPGSEQLFDSPRVAFVIAYHAGNAALEGGRVDEAIEQYDRALETRESDSQVDESMIPGEMMARCLTNKGVACTRRGAVDDALASFDRAIQVHPSFVAAHYNKAWLLDRAGRAVEAAAAWRAYLEAAGDRESERESLAYARDCLDRLGPAN